MASNLQASDFEIEWRTEAGSLKKFVPELPEPDLS
jgi:predicted NUDIX family NTP pyrophosphohydrolase